MAQRERTLIASRTRDGLTALKARGVTRRGSPVRLGNPREGTAEQTLKADAYGERVINEIRKRQAKGITTHEDLADRLTGKIETPRGADRWQATQVSASSNVLGQPALSLEGGDHFWGMDPFPFRL